MRPYASLYIVVHAAGGGIGTRHLGECECTAQGDQSAKDPEREHEKRSRHPIGDRRRRTKNAGADG